jgi:hypothetical protein
MYILRVRITPPSPPITGNTIEALKNVASGEEVSSWVTETGIDVEASAGCGGETVEMGRMLEKDAAEFVLVGSSFAIAEVIDPVMLGDDCDGLAASTAASPMAESTPFCSIRPSIVTIVLR